MEQTQYIKKQEKRIEELESQNKHLESLLDEFMMAKYGSTEGIPDVYRETVIRIYNNDRELKKLYENRHRRENNDE